MIRVPHRTGGPVASRSGTPARRNARATQDELHINRNNRTIPIEVKICGLTTPAAAAACAAAGASAIGMVFHPTSPRDLTPEQARKIAAVVPKGVARVGVFVDQDADAILRIAEQVGLDTVQLHGNWRDLPIEAFQARGLRVVCVLRTNGEELLADERRVPPDAGVLMECGRGVLPGGNGVAWDWTGAAVLCGVRPFAIAGGLTPDTVADAIRASSASAVDVSSGVESAPGVKDLDKVTAFIATVRATGDKACGSVFQPIRKSEFRTEQRVGTAVPAVRGRLGEASLPRLCNE